MSGHSAHSGITLVSEEFHMLAAIEWSQGIEDAWSRVASAVPKLVYFVAVLLIGLFVVRIVTAVVRKIARARPSSTSCSTRPASAHFLPRAGLDRHANWSPRRSSSS